MTMIRNRYVVLRDNGGTFQTIGPSAESYENEHAADIHAKLLASKYPAQAFVVVRVVGEYRFQPTTSVRKLRLVESTG